MSSEYSTERPQPTHAQAALFGDAFPKLKLRRAGALAAKKTIYEAKFGDVAHLMQSGDAFWFSGTAPWSWLIRIATVSNVSHAGMLKRKQNGEIRLLDVVEGKGGRNLPFVDEVAKYPGQYLWGPTQRDKYPEYNGIKAANFMEKLVGTPYGWHSVLWMACWHAPIIRDFVYMIHYRDIDKAFVNQPMYCSDSQSVATETGGVDPVPDRAHQLTSPSDTLQSLLWGPKVALIP
jgi:hypothetical protein